MRLAHYPVTFFAIGMGMMGATLAIRAAERAFAFTHTVSTAALLLSLAMFAAVTVGYAAKALLHAAEVKAEWSHPVRIAFFPAISISLLLLAAALLEPLPQLAHAVWLVLLTLVMNRLMFHDPLPGRMVPTLMILIAPPAVAFTAWLRISGEVGPFGHFLLSVAYVFALLVVTQAPKFRTMPFALSWWALSFPIAALTIASFGYAEAASSNPHRIIGAGLLALLLAVVAGLILRTALAIRAGTICLPE